MTIWIVLGFLGFGVFSILIGFSLAAHCQFVFIEDVLEHEPDISLTDFIGEYLGREVK